MREIKYIVSHCTATPQNTSVESIISYWRNNLGWRNPGYHYIVTADGTVIKLLSEDKVANGVRGYNGKSIHVSYIGGISKERRPLDNRTSQQKEAMLKIFLDLKTRYPKAKILGHRDFPNVAKACPSYDVQEFLKY